MSSIAIMQPYFIPYAGYFRLFTMADHLVFLDDVFFSRNPGYVIRNKFTNKQQESKWLTLPIEKPQRTTPINQLKFRQSAPQDLERQFQHFPSLLHTSAKAKAYQQHLRPLVSSVSAYNRHLLQLICEDLGLPFSTSLSSEIELPPDVSGQERLIAIAKHHHAKTYINLAGGQELYDVDTFAKHGLGLKFLSPYRGNYISILQRLIEEDPKAVRAEIQSNQSFVN